MTFQHLNFDQLSDLLDDEITDELKQVYLRHIALCEKCRHEYEVLCKCIHLLTKAKDEALIIPDICGNTLTLYQARKRKKFMYKTIPAIAASFMVITGIAFLNSEMFIEQGSNHISKTHVLENDTQRIISSIRDADGRIIRMTESYIESAINKKDLPKLEKILKGNNLKYSFVNASGYALASQKNIRNIEDADYQPGFQSEPIHRPVSPGANGSDKNSSIIRIFK